MVNLIREKITIYRRTDPNFQPVNTTKKKQFFFIFILLTFSIKAFSALIEWKIEGNNSAAQVTARGLTLVSR